jgi:hypothetical protein
MFEERRTLFFNKKIILDAVIKKYGEDLRRLILDSNTKLKKGTFGKNWQVKNGTPSINGYLLLNLQDKFACFFNRDNSSYTTAFPPSGKQQPDI